MKRAYEIEDRVPDKEFFYPGDLVQLKHNISNKPTMLITEKVSTSEGDKISLQGMKCIWFDHNQCMCEGVFSTKDLEKV